MTLRASADRGVGAAIHRIPGTPNGALDLATAP